MNPFLLPLFLAGLYRVFRRLKGVNYGFQGILFVVTLVLMFFLHATVRLLGATFIPLGGEVNDEGADFVSAHLGGMFFMVEEDVAADPVEVGFFRAVGVVFGAQGI